MSSDLQYYELSELLSRLGYTDEAAGFHGALCGAICVKPPQQVDFSELLAAGGSPATPAEAGATTHLGRMAQEAARALGSAEMSFVPLLPEEGAQLAIRVQALASWCEGFLYGLTTGRPLDMRKCSPELKEILRDFTQFTQAGLGAEDDQEIEESAYAELVEYIRVGVQLIFMELHGMGASAAQPSDETPTLH